MFNNPLTRGLAKVGGAFKSLFSKATTKKNAIPETPSEQKVPHDRGYHGSKSGKVLRVSTHPLGYGNGRQHIHNGGIFKGQWR